MNSKMLSPKETVCGIMERYRQKHVSPPPEVEKPTYKIVAPIDRYDQRDHPNARAVLIPGSVEYELPHSTRIGCILTMLPHTLWKHTASRSNWTISISSAWLFPRT